MPAFARSSRRRRRLPGGDGPRGERVRLPLRGAHDRAAAPVGGCPRSSSRSRSGCTVASPARSPRPRSSRSASPPSRCCSRSTASPRLGRGRRRVHVPPRAAERRPLAERVRARLRTDRRSAAAPGRAHSTPSRSRARRRGRGRRSQRLSRLRGRDPRPVADGALEHLRGRCRGLDRRSGRDGATLLVTGDRFWPSAWHHLFWNESDRARPAARRAPSPRLIPQQVVTRRTRRPVMAAPAGEVVSAREVVAPAGVTLAAQRLSELPPTEDQPGMALWQVDEPGVRSSQRIARAHARTATYTARAPRSSSTRAGRGRLELTLLGKQALATRVLVDGAVVAERAVHRRARSGGRSIPRAGLGRRTGDLRVPSWRATGSWARRGSSACALSASRYSCGSSSALGQRLDRVASVVDLGLRRRAP